MLKLKIAVLALAALGIATVVIAQSVSSPVAGFCQKIKAGKAQKAGDLFALMERDRREMNKLLSDLSGSAAPAKEICQ